MKSLLGNEIDCRITYLSALVNPSGLKTRTLQTVTALGGTRVNLYVVAHRPQVNPQILLVENCLLRATEFGTQETHHTGNSNRSLAHHLKCRAYNTE